MNGLITRAAVTGLFLGLMGMAMSPGEPEIDWFTIDGGGGTMRTSDNVLELRGTIGQPDAGTLTAGAYTLSGGVRVRFATPDTDGDGDVDLDDYAGFALCETGPDGSLPESCGWKDLDGDADVDLKDFFSFQKSFTGQR
jgi:hypothetical protein